MQKILKNKEHYKDKKLVKKDAKVKISGKNEVALGDKKKNSKSFSGKSSVKMIEEIPESDAESDPSTRQE